MNIGNVAQARNTGPLILLLLSFLIASPGISKATSEDEAISLCVEALKNDYGASEVRNLDFHRHDGRTFVYGYANVGADRVSFRCFAFQEKVESVDYLEPDASVSTGHSLVSARRSRSGSGEQENAGQGEGQREALHPSEPHFVTVQ